MLSLATLILFFITCFLSYLILNRNANYWKVKGVPFEKPLLLVGNILDIILCRKCFGLVFVDLYLKFDVDYFGIWIFNIPQLVVRSPELIKQILVKDFDQFYDRISTSNEEVDEITANIMFFLKNPKWRTVRANTTVIFSSGKMKFIYPQIQTIAKNLVSFIDCKSGGVIETKGASRKYSTDVICSSAFGIDAHSFEEKNSPFITIGESIFADSLQNAITAVAYFCENSLVGVFKIKFIKKWIADFLTTTLMDIIKERETVASNRKDLVDIIISLRKEYNLRDSELVALASQFLLAGYETISSAISFALYELALNEDIQENLREEINENIDDDGNISYTNLYNMEYLDKVIFETLRKYPPVPFLSRICATDYQIPNTDVIIEKGTTIMIPVMGLNHDPKYFPNPEVFDPERFSEENVRQRHQYCYLPFGEGPRNCIGRRMGLLASKIALCQVIRNFKVEACKETAIPLNFNPKTFTLCVNKFYLNFKKLGNVNHK